MPVPPLRFLALIGLVLATGSAGSGAEKEEKKETTPETPKIQDQPAPKKPKPAPPPAERTVTIRQGTLPNPVADEVALIHRLQLSQGNEKTISNLPGIIIVRYPESDLSFAWDPVECRLLFAWHGETPGDLVFVAEGNAPFAATIGVWGPPEFFGYRRVNGGPEFLYHYGNLAVAERIRPAKSGPGWVQEWEVNQAGLGLLVTVPERWRDRVECSAGEWSDASLALDESQAKHFSLTWNASDPPELPELPETWKNAAPPAPAKEAETLDPADTPESPSGADDDSDE